MKTPMMIERHPITDRASWLDMRRQDLTMSEIAAAAGFGLYGTPYEIWARKAGLAAPQEETPAMRLGTWCEPAVVRAIADRHPEFSIDYPLDLYLRDAPNRLGGTPDGSGYHRDRPAELIAFEFKVISRQSFERHWSEGPPLGYQLQTLGNAMLLEANYGILAALVLGFQDAELVIHRIDRNAGAEAGIRGIAHRFWVAFYEGHALVAPDYARDADTIRQVFRPDPQKPAPIDLSADNRLGEILADRERLKAEIRQDEDQCKAIDAEIVAKLAGATAAILPGWKISNALTHRDAYQVPAKDYPVLRISRLKEKAA